MAAIETQFLGLVGAVAKLLAAFLPEWKTLCWITDGVRFRGLNSRKNLLTSYIKLLTN